MREFLMLADVYNSSKITPAGWFMSEKLDGMRAFWDGGISRGMYAAQVPYANTEKDVREHVSTGLWSRYGKVVHAPDWWLDTLPKMFLDGELYMGRQRFQDTISIVRSYTGVNWEHIKFMVFDSPSPATVFQPGYIQKNGCRLDETVFKTFYTERAGSVTPIYGDFERVYAQLRQHFEHHNYCQCLQQSRLPFSTSEANKIIEDELHRISESGGEGIMLRKSNSYWEPTRSKNLLKIKKLRDSEGTVMGYTWGEGKYYGMMGSLKLRLDNGKVLDLSGFTDAERAILLNVNGKIGEPGTLIESGYSPHFKIGDRVTFTYENLSDDDIPLKARYWRPAS